MAADPNDDIQLIIHAQPQSFLFGARLIDDEALPPYDHSEVAHTVWIQHGSGSYFET